MGKSSYSGCKTFCKVIVLLCDGQIFFGSNKFKLYFMSDAWRIRMPENTIRAAKQAARIVFKLIMIQ